MSLEDKFDSLSVSQGASDHINNQLLEKYSHKIKTDELHSAERKHQRIKQIGRLWKMS